MGLDIEGIKKKQKEMTQGKGDRFQFKVGKNRIRIFAFTHKVTKDDVKADLFEKSDIGQTKQKIERAVTVHFIGPKSRPVLSNSEIMGDFQKLNPKWKRGNSKGKPPAGAPTDKFLVNIVDTDERPYRVRYAMMPVSVVRSIFDTVLDEDYGEKVLGAKGRDLIFKYNPDGAPIDMYKMVGVRDKENCAVLPESVEDQVADFFTEDGFAKSGVLLSAEDGDDAEKDEDGGDGESKESDSDESGEEEDSDTDSEESDESETDSEDEDESDESDDDDDDGEDESDEDDEEVEEETTKKKPGRKKK